MKNFKIWALTMLAAAVILSCKKENDSQSQTTPTPTPPTVADTSNLVRVGEGYLVGAAAKMVVYAEKALFVGYNKLYFVAYDSATSMLFTDGHLEVLQPVMTMMGVQHSAPAESEEDINTTTKLWEGAAVFTMPSSGGNWKLHIEFHNHAIDKIGEGEIAVSVVDPATPLMKSDTIAADSNAIVFLSLVQPMTPQIGLNNFEITIHKMADAMTFSAVNDYTVEIDPVMPSMGHGSPNNVNPVLTANGHYVGKVNFTMRGLWRVHIKLYKNGVLLDDTQYFDITP